MQLASPMSKLANRRHEAFAIELASGAPLRTAFITAGYKDSYSAPYNASRLRNSPKVRERVNELLGEFAERSFVKLEWVQARLVEIIERKAESKQGVRDGKPFEEIDRMAALVALAKTLGAINDGATANATAEMAMVTRIERIIVEPQAQPRPIESGREQEISNIRAEIARLEKVQVNGER